MSPAFANSFSPPASEMSCRIVVGRSSGNGARALDVAGDVDLAAVDLFDDNRRAGFLDELLGQFDDPLAGPGRG